jgi:diguanylate cyclase (GGDEF)-like protein
MPFSFRAARRHPLRRVSVQTITALVVAAVLRATAGLAYLTYLGWQHRSKTNEVVEREMTMALLYGQAGQAATAQGAAALAYYMLQNPQFMQDFEGERESAALALSRLTQAVPDDDAEELAKMERLREAHEVAGQVYAEFFDQVDSGDEAAALATLADQGLQGQLRFLIEGLAAASGEAAVRLLEAQHEDEAVQSTWNRIVLAGAAVWALVMGIGGFVAIRWVLRPMARVEKATRAMASGNLSVRVPSVALRELDELATSFNTMAKSLEESTNQLTHAATTDGLTGLQNHRSLQDTLSKEVERSVRYGHPLAVLMMDIDGFKLFNDTHGHQAGDDVLRRVADVLRKATRTSDVIARYGGDEFMVILPNTNRDGAVSMANRITEAFSRERVHTGGGDDLPLAISVGLAVCPDDSRNKQELLAYADASLYEVKQASAGPLQLTRQEPAELIAYRDTPLGVLDVLVRGIDSKDRYTRRHSQQDAELAAELGDELGLSQEPLRALLIAGLLHDVGKIGVPDHVLKKPGPLTDDELKMMQEHVVLGKLIIQVVPNLRDVAEAVCAHHERWDGTGYPEGLKGEEIPLLGRVLAVADAYSAMILDRPYRKALNHEEAVAELRRGAGTQFDPGLVEPFIRLLERRRESAA